ncbi:unnamed protein product, partial [Discosporangium mesarthrocarpum]
CYTQGAAGKVGAGDWAGDWHSKGAGGMQPAAWSRGGAAAPVSVAGQRGLGADGDGSMRRGDSTLSKEMQDRIEVNRQAAIQKLAEKQRQRQQLLLRNGQHHTSPWGGGPPVQQSRPQYHNSNGHSNPPSNNSIVGRPRWESTNAFRRGKGRCFNGGRAITPTARAVGVFQNQGGGILTSSDKQPTSLGGEHATTQPRADRVLS